MIGLAALILLGFAVLSIPLIIIGVAPNLGSEWTTVGEYVAIPIIAICFIGLVILLMKGR